MREAGTVNPAGSCAGRAEDELGAPGGPEGFRALA